MKNVTININAAKRLESISVQVQGVPGDLPPARDTTLLWTMSYGDAPMIEHFGLTTEFLSTKSNFCHRDGYCFRNSPGGDWGAVGNFWRDVDHKFLMDVQPRDGARIERQMNWLINYDGGLARRPLWMSGSELRCGHSVFGHQPVLVESDENGDPVIYEFEASYPEDRVPMIIQFYSALGMPRNVMDVIRTDMLDGIDAHEKYPYWIQRASEAVWRGKDVINWYPAWEVGMESGGKIYYVFWSKDDWLSNTVATKMFLPVIGMTNNPPPGIV